MLTQEVTHKMKSDVNMSPTVYVKDFLLLIFYV